MISLNIRKNEREYIRRFKESFKNREGAEELLKFITDPKRDFFTAPATANSFLSVRGGLCQYALMMNDVVNDIFKSQPFLSILNDPSEKITKETIDVVTLLSPLDNLMLFTTEIKNRKNYDQSVFMEAQARGESIKFDSKGQYVWEAYESYAYDDSLPLGNGVRAISFIQAFMKLTKKELLAIRWGGIDYASGQDRGAMYTALNSNPLILAMQNANMTVQFLLGNEKYFDRFNDDSENLNNQQFSNPQHFHSQVEASQGYQEQIYQENNSQIQQGQQFYGGHSQIHQDLNQGNPNFHHQQMNTSISAPDLNVDEALRELDAMMEL